MSDQRVGTRLLGIDEQAEVRKLFELPSGIQGGAGELDQWDAWEDAEHTRINEEKKQALMKELTDALGKEIEGQWKNAEWKLAAIHIPMSQLVPIAEAAKRIVDGFFADWLKNVALSSDQAAARANRRFTPEGPNLNIIEVRDEKARETAGKPVNPWDALCFTAANNRECKSVMKSHGFYPNIGRASEKEVLREILTAYFKPNIPIENNPNLQALVGYDLYGFALSDPESGKIFVSGAVPNFDGTDAWISQPVRDRKWVLFGKIVHEYIHLLEHPLIPAATNRSVIVREGFCEYLTIQVIRHLQSIALKEPYGPEMTELTKNVEHEEFVGKPDTWRGSQGLARYESNPDYLPHVEKVRGFAAKYSENAVRAIFFQGHTEFLGRSGDTWLPPAPPPVGGVHPTPIAETFRSLDMILKATRLSREDVLRHNPDLQGSERLPAHLNLPGHRGHLVTAVKDGVETWEQIAAQHGLETARLAELYDIAKPPQAGDWLIVPAGK